MSKKLTKAEVIARAEAYTSAADHLVLAWTDDELEIAEGAKLSAAFYKKAEQLHYQAYDMDDD